MHRDHAAQWTVGGRSRAERRPADPSVLGQRCRETTEGKQPEDEQRPGADRHRRPVLEHRPVGVGLDQHVPEAQRPREIERQQAAADDDARKRDVVAEARERTVLAPAEEVEQRRQEIAPPARPPTKK